MNTMEKICTNCNTPKPATDFYKGCNYCKICYKAKYGVTTKARANRWSANNKDKVKEKNLRRTQSAKAQSELAYKHECNMYSIKSSYGLTEKDLQDLLARQKGCCKTCGGDFGVIEMQANRNRAYMIDHDHVTGRVRGLLCHACNIVIGHIENLKVSPDVYKAYLGATNV